MITRETVFVLGAGASAAYGFPLGPQLITDVCSDLSSPGHLAFQRVKDAAESSDDEVTRFRGHLLNAARDSIDAFLNTREKDYDLLGRCAIVQQLLKYESDAAFREPAGSDWYAYLLRHILGTSPAAFRRNRLKVITFNFDRSFERRLLIALEANYGTAATELLSHIPVLHIHGRLGGDFTQRSYVPATTADVIRSCADGVRVVHHTVDDVTLGQARNWLQRAERIYFLGFSYHRLNLEKLGLPDTLQPVGTQASKNTYGTRLRMPTPEINSLPPSIRNAITFLEEADDIMSMLRRHGNIYDWE